jgi:uncharacterized protein YaiI (UPF0178 family)
MKIWVDADACPKPVKDILFRLAERTEIAVTLVANQGMRLPDSPFIKLIQVGHGADVADDEIVNMCEAGDLIITADIPLAARVVEKGAQALDPRGKVYDENNIGQILSMRNFMDELRGSGVETGGPNSFGQKERFKFANELDKFIATRRGANEK